MQYIQHQKKEKRNAHHAKTQEVVQKYYAMNILNLPSFSACLSFEVDKSQKVSKNDLTKKEKQKRKEMKCAEKVSFFLQPKVKIAPTVQH